MSTLTSTQLQQQYIAYFGRPGDPAGIKYWLSSSSGVSTARDFADKIYAQDEYKTSTVGTKTVEAQVNQLYINLFGRSADATGLLYWTQEIEQGNLSLSNVATDLIWSASNPSSGNTAQGALDASALTNKVAAAAAYTAEVEASTTAILAYQPATTTPFKTSTAFTSAVTYLGTITSAVEHTAAGITSTVTSMTAGSDAASSTTTNLTTDTDTLTGSGNADTYKGSIVYSAAGTTTPQSGSTFTVDDTINGAVGSDTLALTVSGVLDGGAVGIPAADTSNIESLEVRTVASETTNGTDYLQVDASNFSGLTSFTNDRSTGTIDLNNLPTGATYIHKGNGTVTMGDTTTVDYSTATDAVNITLDGGVVAGAASDITNSGSATTATVKSTGAANKIDILALASGNNTITSLTIDATTAVSFGAGNANDQAAITGLAADSTITITGAGAVDIETVDADVDVIDASGNSGGLQVALSSNTSTVTTGSSAADIITSGATFTTSTTGSVNAGAGSDTLVIGTNVGHINNATEAGKYTNFETLSLNGTLDLSYIGSQIESIILTGATNSITKLNATQAASITTSADIGATTIALLDGSGTSDSVTINLGNAKGNAHETGALTVNKFETINIVANPKAGNADLTSILDSITADKATTININGTNKGNVTITDAAVTKAATYDATSLPGLLTLGGNLIAGSTVKGSAGADVITLGTVGSTYNGNAGNDSFSGTAITVLESSSVWNTIDGGAGTDTIALTASALAGVDTNFRYVSNVETLTLDSDGGAGDLSLTTGGFFDSAFKDGGATINLLGSDTDKVTLSADTFSGDATVTVTSLGVGNAADEDISVTTGDGSDTVTVTASSWIATAGAASGIAISTGAGDDTITMTTGTLLAQTSGDYVITPGTGADTVTISSSNSTTDDSEKVVTITDGDSLATGRDKITGFKKATGTNMGDVLNFDTATVATATTGSNGTDYGVFKSHKIASGIITLDDADSYASAVTVDTTNLSDALDYLAANISTAGHTVALAYDSDNNATADGYIVFNQGTLDSVVELVGVTGATSIITTNAATNLAIVIG